MRHNFDIEHFLVDTFHWRQSLDELIFRHDVDVSTALKFITSRIALDTSIIDKKYKEYLRDVLRLPNKRFKYMDALLAKEHILLPKFDIETSQESVGADMTHKHPTHMCPDEKKLFTVAYTSEIGDLIFSGSMTENEAIRMVSDKYGMQVSSVKAAWRRKKEEVMRNWDQKLQVKDDSEDSRDESDLSSDQVDTSHIEERSYAENEEALTVPNISRLGRVILMNPKGSLLTDMPYQQTNQNAASILQQLADLLVKEQESILSVSKSFDEVNENFEEKMVSFVKQMYTLKEALDLTHTILERQPSVSNA